MLGCIPSTSATSPHCSLREELSLDCVSNSRVTAPQASPFDTYSHILLAMQGHVTRALEDVQAAGLQHVWQ